MEVQRKYPDILLVPRDETKGYKAIMVEFKYVKKGEDSKLEEKQKEVREQIEEYAIFEEIEKLSKYTIVVINDKLHVKNMINVYKVK